MKDNPCTIKIKVRINCKNHKLIKGIDENAIDKTHYAYFALYISTFVEYNA